MVKVWFIIFSICLANRQEADSENISFSTKKFFPVKSLLQDKLQRIHVSTFIP